ncbi:hypothetical protein A9762_11665 [Pandoraea sp. ISTKB]|nr:hypothetical protein A9762_11665 [Pandoraea sp. ISTKB]
MEISNFERGTAREIHHIIGCCTIKRFRNVEKSWKATHRVVWLLVPCSCEKSNYVNVVARKMVLTVEHSRIDVEDDVAAQQLLLSGQSWIDHLALIAERPIAYRV